MKTLTLTLTEEEADRVIFALGCYTGQAITELGPGEKRFMEIHEASFAIVTKIGAAKQAARK